MPPDIAVCSRLLWLENVDAGPASAGVVHLPGLVTLGTEVKVGLEGLLRRTMKAVCADGAAGHAEYVEEIDVAAGRIGEAERAAIHPVRKSSRLR